jgi:hypothetical protein
MLYCIVRMRKAWRNSATGDLVATEYELLHHWVKKRRRASQAQWAAKNGDVSKNPRSRNGIVGFIENAVAWPRDLNTLAIQACGTTALFSSFISDDKAKAGRENRGQYKTAGKGGKADRE